MGITSSTGKHQPIAYRQDIDGLRAIAVVAVMLFHAGVGAFSGGYVGVDVFFVISGYLITSITLAEKQAGSFHFISFYERRARRILPALLLVALACLPLAWLCLLPPDMGQFALSLLALLGFSSNLFFWRTSGYFETGAELSPLLHTWSLAVEEQYYLLYPILLMFACRLGRRRVVPILIGVAIASACLAQWGSIHRPAANFFLLPTRAWEILSGALCALQVRTVTSRRRTGTVDECLSVLGCLLIGFAVFGFDSHTPGPSLYTVIPIVGTALLILFGDGTALGRLLGSRLMAGMGLISYSVYLWHQPLYAFLRHAMVEAPPTWSLASMTVLAVVLGYLSWRWVEVPCRNGQLVHRKQFFAAAWFATTITLVFAMAAHYTQGFEFRLSPVERTIMVYERYPHAALYEEGVCFLDSEQTYTKYSDRCAGNKSGDTTLVWGDSHAAALSVGLRSVIGNLARYSASGCPPLLNYHSYSNRHCEEINKFILDQVALLRPSRVLLHANWLNQPHQERLELLIKSTVVAILKRSPSSRITVVGPVPQWHISLPSTMVKTGTPLKDDQFLRNPVARELSDTDATLNAIALAADVNFLSARAALCNGDQCQVTVQHEHLPTLTAWDYGHLTAGGSLLLAGRLAGQLQ